MAVSATTIKSIILAEDDEDDKFIFADAIKTIDARMKVSYVPNGASLTELLHHFLPDILFLDLDMPQKNGLQCLLEIRNSERLSDLPTVVFSSTTRPANIQTAYEVGAHLFLIKSSNFRNYTNSLDAILNMDWSDPQRIRAQFCIDGKFTAFA